MTAEEPDVFVDTNVLVYLFDTSDPRRRDIARGIVASRRGVVSTQVLSEFYVVATRKLAVPVPSAQAEAFVTGWPTTRVVPLTARLVGAAVATSRAHQLNYWDALIIEAAASAGCPVCLTEDLNDGATLRGVRITNPFTSDQPPTGVSRRM